MKAVAQLTVSQAGDLPGSRGSPQGRISVYLTPHKGQGHWRAGTLLRSEAMHQASP